MRRIIHNTTAVAACLSLLAPHLAMAKPVTPSDAARPAAASQAPELLILAQAETAPDAETADDAEIPPLTPEEQAARDAEEAAEEAARAAEEAEQAADEAEEAQAEEPAAEEPAAEAVPEPEPAADAPAEPVADPEPAPEPEAQATPEDGADLNRAMTAEDEAAQPRAEDPAAEPQDAPAEAAPAAEPATPSPRAEEAPRRNPRGENRERREDGPRANPQRGNNDEAPRAEEADENQAADQDAGDDAGALAEALRAADGDAQNDDQQNDGQQDDQAAEAEQTDADPVDALADALRGDTAETPAEQPAAAGGDRLNLAAGSVQAERSTNLPGLADVLASEVDAGLTAESLTCLSGGSFPCADNGRAMTPSGVVVEANGAGELRLAPADAQMYRVENGQLVQRAAEEDTPETDVSREAAQVAAPSNAAALEAEDGSGEVSEQQVTEENSRSSSEDFTTSLRDALAATTQQNQARSDDGGNNDLRNALLLGLGALAVGSILNNNRQVALSAPDRVVVTRPDGSQEVIRDDVALFRQPGSTVTTENFDDGSSRTIVTRPDGSRVVTIRDANLQVLRRTLVSADGTSTPLIDDTVNVQPVDVSSLPPAARPVQTSTAPLNEDQLREALLRESNIDRRFTLSQIRNIPEVRALVAPVNIDAITFDTGSAAIRPAQAEALQALGRTIQEAVRQNPREIFMIEGHTDTVGSDAANLALSDRRAESVALALAEYFDVPTENLVTQGYGEQFLRVRAEGDIRENRRASVRRITDLLAQ